VLFSRYDVLGLACAAFTQRVAWTVQTDSTIIALIKWISTTLIFPLPTIVISIREADKAGVRYTFEQLFVSAVLGLFTAVFLGAALEVTLSFAGVHHFLGIPINPWR
jgi:membrane-anchored glycerophosphoryl diester phosphodiesterase (GDPDase)